MAYKSRKNRKPQEKKKKKIENLLKMDGDLGLDFFETDEFKALTDGYAEEYYHTFIKDFNFTQRPVEVIARLFALTGVGTQNLIEYMAYIADDAHRLSNASAAAKLIRDNALQIQLTTAEHYVRQQIENESQIRVPDHPDNKAQNDPEGQVESEPAGSEILRVSGRGEAEESDGSGVQLSRDIHHPDAGELVQGQEGADGRPAAPTDTGQG